MRILVLFISFLFALPVFAQQQAIDIQLNAPDQVVAGTEFQVTVTFNKGELKDYSRFSQDLPKGFTAKNINSPNADFTFNDQRVRIIWLKLPAGEQVVVNYSITSHPRIEGDLELTGTFAYVDDGERAFLNLANPKTVKILPNPDIDQSLVVNIQDFSSIEDPDNMGAAFEPVAEQADFANVVRQAPIVEPNGIVNISMLVKKPEGTNFLKIEESIPGGYSFEAVESNNAVVSQAASIARFVWMRPPDASAFLVKYRLIPILERTQEPLIIDGNLTYTESGETRLSETREMEVNVSALSPEQQLELLKTGNVPENIASIETPTVTEQGSQGTREQVAENRTTQQTNADVREEIRQPQETVRESVPTKQVNRNGESTVIDIAVLQPANGVYFRVQVAAVRNPLFVNVFFADFSLLRDVKVEKLEGWHKYTVGDFSSYEEAKAMKDRINTETSLNRAFVVAYRNGLRVPVAEVR